MFLTRGAEKMDHMLTYIVRSSIMQQTETLQKAMGKPTLLFATEFYFKSTRQQNNRLMRLPVANQSLKIIYIPYTRFWTLTIYRVRIFSKNFHEKAFLTFKKWVKNIQTMSYNGVHKLGIVHNVLNNFAIEDNLMYFADLK